MTSTPDQDRRRGSATERGYDGRWRKARLTFLAANPLCAYCRDKGRVTAASVVNHRIPHRGDQKLFWDRDNWVPLCKAHHDSTAQREDVSGRRVGCDVDGWPLGGR